MGTLRTDLEFQQNCTVHVGCTWYWNVELVVWYIISSDRHKHSSEMQTMF